MINSSSVHYVKRNILDINPIPGIVIAHSVNAQGVWGAGVAAALKEKYPLAYKGYRKHCKDRWPGSEAQTLLGTYSIHQSIACLYTSSGYGARKDSVPEILANTALAVASLLSNSEIVHVYSPKINSGLFNVPWEYTEKIIKAALVPYKNKIFNKCWIVCEI